MYAHSQIVRKRLNGVAVYMLTFGPLNPCYRISNRCIAGAGRDTQAAACKESLKKSTTIERPKKKDLQTIKTEHITNSWTGRSIDPWDNSRFEEVFGKKFGNG